MFITNFMKAIYLGHVYMSFFIIFERELKKDNLQTNHPKSYNSFLLKMIGFMKMQACYSKTLLYN